MWRGAGAMIMMQEDELGGQIELEGDELAAIIAFIHDEEEQLKFTLEDVPHDMRHFMMPDFVETSDHEMWRGAGAMIMMQEDELDGQIELEGDELAGTDRPCCPANPCPNRLRRAP